MTSTRAVRVVCLVPSWTETLVYAGVDVVGRTRFCIHPRDQVAAIPIVGGTRDVNWASVTAMAPDLLILDREESPVALAEQSPIPWLATDVTCASDVEQALRTFHQRLACPELLVMADRWHRVCMHLAGRYPAPDWSQLPGVVEWLRPPGPQVRRFAYLIWQGPWKAAGRHTFIGSVLDLLGFGSRMVPVTPGYPEIRLTDLDPGRTLLLFSTEPYPFDQRKDALHELPFPSAIVNGESYTWFGIRTLRFLDNYAYEASS